MEQIATTPFGARPVTACLVRQMTLAQRAPQARHADKFALYEALRTAKTAFAVTDRDLCVLYALLSFHPGKTLSENERLVVFPSNRALAARAHGMAESTLRRHLAALVRAGVLRRHDSPNGKRFAAKDTAGEIVSAFGFDLRPLLERAQDIQDAAQDIQNQQEALKQARLQVSVLRRDATKLLAYAQDTCPAALPDGLEAELLDLHRLWRRKPTAKSLQDQRQRLGAVLKVLHQVVSKAENLDGSAAHSERHQSDSNTEPFDSELSQKLEKGAPDGDLTDPPRIPLVLVLKACPDILPYADRPPRHWHDLVIVAARVRSMMGISPDAWAQAQAIMGPEVAAICVAGILQRVSDINSPGGYLRALTAKAGSGAFSPGPMIMALLQSAPAPTPASAR